MKHIHKERFTVERNGLKIRGTRYGDPAGHMPAVILSHGFMANSIMCRTYAKLLAETGYLAFIYDFCGGCLIGRSSGKTTDMSVLTEKEDLAAVIRYVSSLPYVDRDRISLLGCSQGGFVSAMVAADMPERISSLVLLYPALCIPDDARKGRMMFAKFDPADVPEKIWCGPMRLGAGYVKAVQNMDPCEAIRGYTGPVLYLHGTADKIVDIGYARRAKDEYPNCEYHEIDGGGHMFHGKHDRIAQAYIRDLPFYQRSYNKQFAGSETTRLRTGPFTGQINLLTVRVVSGYNKLNESGSDEAMQTNSGLPKGKKRSRRIGICGEERGKAVN